jgi:serine/threonine-protein kinase HipA
MTSSLSQSEAYVYITLPGEVNAITAGQFVLNKDRRGIPRGRFVYRRSYLERPDAVEIDPLELKLLSGTKETAKLQGVFGALRDAGPDYWGRRLIERHAGRPMLCEIDYLLESPDDRAGALGFGRNTTPPAPKRDFNSGSGHSVLIPVRASYKVWVDRSDSRTWRWKVLGDDGILRLARRHRRSEPRGGN